MVTLNTPRLRMRELVPGDFAAAHAWLALPETSAHDDWGPNTEADTAEWLEFAIETAAADPRATFILAVERDGLVGSASIDVDWRHRSASFGCVLSPALWGNGYGTEICRALIRFGFDDLHLHRLTAICSEENTASIRGLEALGLSLEGRMRQDRFLRGRYVDSRLYALLNPADLPR
jgi:ribosomal-protein-alanine N-acetyltransferase